MFSDSDGFDSGDIAQRQVCEKVYAQLEAAVIGTVLGHDVSSSRWLSPRDASHRSHKMQWRFVIFPDGYTLKGHLVEEFSSLFHVEIHVFAPGCSSYL